MSSFLEWVRSHFVPERTEGKFNLLRANLTYLKPFKMEKDVPSGVIVCYVNLKYQNNDIKLPTDIKLIDINKTVEVMLLADQEGKSKLKLTLYTETEIMDFVWGERSSCWIAFGQSSVKKMYNWATNLPKAVINLQASRDNCRKETIGFLVDYLITLRSDPDIKLTDTYQSFISESIKSLTDYIYSEIDSLRDSRFIPRCRYQIGGTYDQDEKISKVYLFDPPRIFMRDGVHVRPKRSQNNLRNKTVSEGYIFEEEALLLPKKDLSSWPLEGELEQSPNLTESYRKLDAINSLSNPIMIHHQRLLDLLSRPLSLPEIEPLNVVNIKAVFQRDNKESGPQCKAIDKAFGSQDITLIQGPPGTGKTEVICEMILQVIRKGGRVLLTSPTNIAVDNVLERIYEEKEVRPIRIGHPDRIYKPEIKKLLLSYQVKNWKNITRVSQEDKKDTHSQNSATELKQLQSEFFNRLDRENFREIRSMIIDQSNLVCGTCIGVVNMEFSEVSLEQPFDLMIVDEASKATLLEFLVPAVRARKWVLVGDHRQLAPYVSDIELKLYLQKFLEKSGIISTAVNASKKQKKKKETDLGGLREYSKFVEFHPKVESIMRDIRRYHEEFHNLEGEYSEKYLRNILREFNYQKTESVSFIEMVESSLGSCFHYFWKRVDESRKSYLPFQHRMPEAIATLLNTSIYDNKFHSSDDAKLHGYHIPLNSENFSSSPKSPTVFIDTSLQKNRHEKQRIIRRKGKEIPGSYFNELESKVILQLLDIICSKYPLKKVNNAMKKEIYNDDNPFRIGIITFYSQQSDEIKKCLSGVSYISKTENKWLFKHNDKPIEIRVSIVDRFQGQEQEIILLSIVRSNLNKKAGFLQNIQRLNVALSRARHNMFIIGDHQFFIKLPRISNKDNRKKSNTLNPNAFLIKLARYYERKKWVSKYVANLRQTKPSKNSNKNHERFGTLVSIIDSLSQVSDKVCTFSNIGKKLLELDPDWKKKFGYKTVSKFLEEAKEKKLVQILTAQDGNSTVKLTEEAQNYLTQTQQVSNKEES